MDNTAGSFAAGGSPSAEGSGGSNGVPKNTPQVVTNWSSIAAIDGHLLLAGAGDVREGATMLESCTMIAQYEPSGLRNWFQCLQKGPNGEQFSSLATTLGIDAHGGIYVAGPSRSLARIGMNGETAWVQQLSDDPWINASRQIPATEQSDDLHVGQLDPSDRRFSLLLAFDAEGALKWSTSMGHDLGDRSKVTFQGPACDAKGACRVIATYTNLDDGTFSRELQLVDADGGFASATPIDLACDPPYVMFIVPSTGDMYVGDGNAEGKEESCLAKISATGKVSWYKSLTPVGQTDTRQFAFAKDGSAIYEGLSVNHVDGLTLTRYDRSGKVIWSQYNADNSKRLGGSTQLAVDPSNSSLFLLNQGVTTFSTADGSDLGRVSLN